MRAGLALLAPLVVAACITIQMAPAGPAASGGEPIDWTQRTLAPPPPRTPRPSTAAATPHPPPGWVAATCTLEEFAPRDDPDWMGGARAVEYAQDGGACLIPASPTAVLSFREELVAPFVLGSEELAPGLDASVVQWVADWRGSEYPGPWSSIVYGTRTLSFELDRERAALGRAFNVGNTARVVEVPDCAIAARDALVEAVGAQLGALAAETVAEADRELARFDELVASARAMEASCPP